MRNSIVKIFTLIVALFAAQSIIAQTTMNSMDKVDKMEKHSMTDKAPKVIQLTQIPGEYETKELSLKAGAYIFEITNKNVDHPVAFFLTSTLDVETPVENSLLEGGLKIGTSGKSGVVNLTPGTYQYSCPMNPTDKYSLTVTP